MTRLMLISCGFLITSSMAVWSQTANVSSPAPIELTATLVEQRKLAAGSATQGLALTEKAYYSADAEHLYRYDTHWNLQAQKAITIEGVNHLGAIHIHDGFIWAGLLQGPVDGKHDKRRDRAKIAKIDADSFDVVKVWDITEYLKWIDPVFFDGQQLWVGAANDLGIHQFRLRNDTWVKTASLRYPAEYQFSQGLRIVDDQLFTMHTFGTQKGLYRFPIPSMQKENEQLRPTHVWRIRTTGMNHLEGFAFVPGSPSEIWHAQDTQVDRYRLQWEDPQ